MVFYKHTFKLNNSSKHLRTKCYSCCNIAFKGRQVSTPTIYSSIVNLMLQNKLGFMYQQDNTRSYTGSIYIFLYSIP